MDCGEFAASSVNTSEAERCPSATGLKFTVILQLACVATAAAMHVLVCEKSPGFEPLIATPETCNVLLPEFVTWTDLAATVAPSSTVPKSKFAGEIVTLGVVATPVPTTTAVCGLPAALSATSSTVPKSKFAGEIVTLGVVATPVPTTTAVCGLPAALSATSDRKSVV